MKIGRIRAELSADPQREKMLSEIDMMTATIESVLSFERDDTLHEERSLVDFSALIEDICEDASDAGDAATFSGPRGGCEEFHASRSDHMPRLQQALLDAREPPHDGPQADACRVSSEVGLPPSYPMVAPNYAKVRSSLAKKIGLGRKAAGRKSARKSAR